MGEGSWIRIEGADQPELAGRLKARLDRKVRADEVNLDEIRRVEKLTFLPAGKIELGGESLDKLRRLCQLWDIDLRCQGISSHRPLIGPLIVAIKKLLYPVLKVFLKDTLQQQRDFNAAAVSLLADLASGGRKSG